MSWEDTLVQRIAPSLVVGRAAVTVLVFAIDKELPVVRGAWDAVAIAPDEEMVERTIRADEGTERQKRRDN